jgi:hypothetical protein
MSESATAEESAVTMPRLGVQAVLRTDVGLVRSENQDFGTYTTPREESHSHPGGRLLVVADGMGGHRGGATASRLAGETVKAQYLGSETYDIAQALRESLMRANARIFTEAQANPDLRGMGTTTSALVVKDNKAWFAHVGDSRIYLVRGDNPPDHGDHSLVASMVREGLLTRRRRRRIRAGTFPALHGCQRRCRDRRQRSVPVQSDAFHSLQQPAAWSGAELKQIAGLPIDQAATEYAAIALSRGATITVIVARIIGWMHRRQTLVDNDETADRTPARRTRRDTPRRWWMTEEPVRGTLSASDNVATAPSRRHRSPGGLKSALLNPIASRNRLRSSFLK